MNFKAPRILNDTTAIISQLVSIVLILIVVSFKDYFFFVPDFSTGITVISVCQIFSSIGWVFLICIPPILISRTTVWDKEASRNFLVSVLLWPVATTLIKIFTFITYKVWVVQYLFNYPIFFFMDFIVPILYIILWLKMRDTDFDEQSIVSKRKLK
jgi:hypothetical protein